MAPDIVTCPLRTRLCRLRTTILKDRIQWKGIELPWLTGENHQRNLRLTSLLPHPGSKLEVYSCLWAVDLPWSWRSAVLLQVPWPFHFMLVTVFYILSIPATLFALIPPTLEVVFTSWVWWETHAYCIYKLLPFLPKQRKRNIFWNCQFKTL